MEINEEIKQKMIEYLQSFEAGIKKAGDFSAEQAPLVVQEFLAWEFWGSLLLAVAFFSMAVLLFAAIIVGVRRTTDDEGRFLISLFAGAPAVALFVLSGAAVYDAIRVSVAPRIVVLEKVASLVE